MEFIISIGIVAGVFGLSLWLTGLVRRYAVARQLLDVPNVRSSHSVATPRGGGVAIVVTTLIGILAAVVLDALSGPLAAGLVGGGALVGAIGFVEDHRELARRWRLLAHVAASVWVLLWIGGLPPIQAYDRVLDLGWAGHALAALYLTWLINLTNFMDGIDGIAAIETTTTCIGGALLCGATSSNQSHWLGPLILAAASLGFLAWNWPPARIFMGDAGSGFLGLLLAALSIQAGWLSSNLLWSWIILLGVFIVDATVTLLRRAVRGERFYEAHRSHAYQHAALRCGTHKPVTLAVAAINLGFLLPVAFLVARGSLSGLSGIMVSYTPLFVAAMWLGAGEDSIR